MTAADHLAPTDARVPRLALVLVVLEGWLYLFGLCLLFAAELALVVWGFLTRNPFVAVPGLFVGVPLLLITGSAVRALLFRFPGYPGIEVSRDEAPALHAMIEEVRRQLDAPPVHRVLVGTDFNAAAVYEQFRDLRGRNALLIGWPLFYALTPHQMRAVVAHELAHFARGDDRVAGLVHRTRLSWARMLDALERKGSTPIFVYWIMRYYAPRLMRLSSEVSRERERMADRGAARIAGSDTVAQTMVCIEAGSVYLEEIFWPRVHARLSDEPEPPAPYAELRAELCAGALCPTDPEQRARLLANAAIETETHPSLHERLARIGAALCAPVVPDVSAGEVLLGDAAPRIADRLNERWHAKNGEEWRRRHAAVAADRRRLEELEACETPSAAERYERACLTEQLIGTDVLPLYEEAWEAGHAPAGLAAGSLLLDDDDIRGIELIESAVGRDNSLAADGYQAIAEFYDRRGDLINKQKYARILTRHATVASIAEKERSEITPVDDFVSHDAGAEQVERLVARLKNAPTVTEAFLVTRKLRYSPGCELVLCLRGTASPDRFEPEQIRVVFLGKEQGLLRRVVEAIPGSRIYRR